MESSPITENPKIFISYSWSNPKHEEWVLELSKRLVSDGIDVIIDKWCLKEGQDLYHFMEQMVRSEEIFKVLTILDKVYQKKADNRSGGVGTETQIISPEIYSNVSQEKFIPIIAQLDENGKPYIPNFLKGRIYINLAETESFEEEYEKLIRNIYQRPSHRKPKLGKAPSFIFEEEENSNNLRLQYKNLERSFEKHQGQIPIELDKFISEVLLALEKLRISSKNMDADYDRAFMNSLNDMIEIRNEIIKFFELYCNHNFNNIQLIAELFEKLYVLTEPPEGMTNWNNMTFDNYRFFIREIFFYFVATMLKYRKYDELGDFFFKDFLFHSRFNTNLINSKFDIFHQYISSLDVLHKKLSRSNLLSITGDLLLKRTHKNYESSMIVEADLLCYYMSKIVGGQKRWFPILYVYRDNIRFDTLRKLKSKGHFDNIKGLFKVENVEELKRLLSSLKFETIGYELTTSFVPSITEYINIELIGSLN